MLHFTKRDNSWPVRYISQEQAQQHALGVKTYVSKVWQLKFFKIVLYSNWTNLEEVLWVLRQGLHPRHTSWRGDKVWSHRECCQWSSALPPPPSPVWWCQVHWEQQRFQSLSFLYMYLQEYTIIYQSLYVI